MKNPIGIVLSLFTLSLTGCSGCTSHTEGVADAGGTEAKEVVAIDVVDSDKTIELDAENTEVKWSCANAVGLVQVGYFFELNGVAIVNDSNELRQIDLEFDMKEMKANALSLSKKLQGPGFFETEKYPTASFHSTSISNDSLGDSPEATTHLVEANFQVRDVTKSITIPVSVNSDADSFSLTSEFKLNRKDYGVVHPVSIEDAAINDEVVLSVMINVRHGTEDSRESSATDAQVVDLGPKFTEEIPATLVEFEMIRVPGDTSKGIDDFYMGKCEVTWEEFDFWALCKDQSEKDAVMLRNRLLRPSAPHDLEATYRNWGREGQPALGVSKKAAELYCQWLSEQTGKKYRLPTLAEWIHAHELGGGDDYADKLAVAWFEQNSLDEEGFDNRAMKVGSLQPNAIGIHDMLGNVSEWVSDQSIVVGGNFLSLEDDLSCHNTENEDQNIWNATYPQLPKSIWWYKDADYVGFRVACDAN